MSVSSFTFIRARKALAQAELNWVTDTVKMMLLDSGYTPDTVAHQFKSDLSHEIVGSGYVAGGVALTTKTLVYDTGLAKVLLGADDANWPSESIAARFGLIYKDTGTAGTSILLGGFDFGADTPASGVGLLVDWGTAGVFQL